MAVATRGPSRTPSPSWVPNSDAMIRLWNTTTLLYRHKIYSTAIDFSKTLLTGTTATLIRSILTINIGIMFNRLEAHEEAEHCFEEAAMLRPELCIAQFLLGTAAYKGKHFKKAETAFKDCRLLFPKGQNCIDYSSLGLEYILRLDLVITNEVYSTWEWCQPQMASVIQDLPPHPLHTLDNELLFHPTRFLSADQDHNSMSEDLRSLFEKDPGATDRLRLAPTLHCSKAQFLTPSRSFSSKSASRSALARAASAIKDQGSITEARSLNSLGNVAARHHPDRTTGVLSLRIPDFATSTPYGCIEEHSGEQPKVATETAPKPGATGVLVQSDHCLPRTPKPMTFGVELRSRFSDSSGYRSPDDALITPRTRDRPRLVRQTLKRMASKAFTKSRMLLESSSCNEKIESTSEAACKAEVLSTSRSTSTCEVDRSDERLEPERRVGSDHRMMAREARVDDRAYDEELLSTLALDPRVLTSNSVASERHPPQYTNSVPPRHKNHVTDFSEPECDIPLTYVAPADQDAVRILQATGRFCRGEMRSYDEQAAQAHPVTHSQPNDYLSATSSGGFSMKVGSTDGGTHDRFKWSGDSSSWYETLRILCGSAEFDSTYDQEELQQHRDWCCYHTNDDSILQDEHLIASRPAPPIPSCAVEIPAPVRTPPPRYKSTTRSKGFVAGLQDHTTRSTSGSRSPSVNTSSPTSPITPPMSRSSPLYSFRPIDNFTARKDSILRESPKSFSDMLDTVDEEALELIPEALRVRSRETSKVRMLVAKFEK